MDIGLGQAFDGKQVNQLTMLVQLRIALGEHVKTPAGPPQRRLAPPRGAVDETKEVSAVHTGATSINPLSSQN